MRCQLPERRDSPEPGAIFCFAEAFEERKGTSARGGCALWWVMERAVAK